MDSFSNYKFFLSSRLISIWLVLILASIGYSGFRTISGDAFESNILSLMPTDNSQNSLLTRGLQEHSERQFVILVSDPKKDAVSGAGLAPARALRKALESLSRVALISIPLDTEASFRNYYRPYRYQILSATTRDFLASKSPQEIAELRLKNLYSAVPDYSLYEFYDDPLNISGPWLQSIFIGDNGVQPSEVPSVIQGDVTWYIVAGELQGSPFDLQLQTELLAVIDDIEQQHPNARLLTSGLTFHAASGSKLAQYEISTVGLGSLLGVLLLVLVVFRSIKQSLFILLVLGSSTLVGLSVTWLLFGRVHLVTLAFGSTLLGLAADYCFHFLVKLNATGRANRARSLIFKGLIISTLSSMAAYMIQLLSPFPGLHQFAVFVTSGLAAACFTVLVLSAGFSDRVPVPVKLGFIYEAAFKPLYSRLAEHRRAFTCIAGLMLLSLIVVIWSRGVSDDIRLLNTSGAQMLEVESRVASLLDSVDLQRYFLVTGTSTEQVLQRAEALAGLVGQQSSIDLVSVAAIIPSLDQQNKDYALVKEKIFAPEGALTIICQRLGGGCDWVQPIPEFNPLLGSVELPRIMGLLFPQLDMLKDNASVIFFRKPAEIDMALFESLRLEGVTYIDRVEILSDMLKGFRIQVSWLLVGFLAMLWVASCWMFGRASLVVVGSVIGSSVIGLFFAAPEGITLFHILALLLVIGIAVDTAVFFITPGLDRNTWAAATLAILTSIIAFGLLSMSKVPLLNQFGQVVVYGLVASWIITPAFWFVLHRGNNKWQLGGRK